MNLTNLFHLHNQQVLITRGSDLVPARVIGFSFDPETDRQPQVLVRYLNGETDDVYASRVCLANQRAA